MDKSREHFEKWMSDNGKHPLAIEKMDKNYILATTRTQWEAWQASRAAVEIELLADKRRMDWLVSKVVNVRDPMVYGSHSLFWSQVITDEEDDYYETKLREQIDAAMDAEAIRAAGLKVKGE
ncbi:hypothetical protein ACVR2H_000162 [Cronobacter sakazakii]|uniref:hypothetical protein n=1 Tax=Cronobacter sakazakii TaxID=28141 RepID=UPI001F18DF3D|nr:hypothetical protein [Cronobacter sakazakii]